MKKFSKKLIEDYIQGKEIEGYKLEELENDKDFMMQVIEVSNDKKIYTLCSDNVKKDYEFVKYIVLKFKNDINFICNVADYFLNDVKNELYRLEIILIMRNLIINNVEKNKDYCILSDTIYSTKRLEIECIKAQYEDYNKVGMGFLVVQDIYKNSDIILKFFAKKILEEIFKENDIDLENLLHNFFSSSNQINDIGINNYIINIVCYYDFALSNYLKMHQDLLSNLNQEIIIIQNNWDNYNSQDERKKYNLIIDKFYDFYDQIKDKTIFTDADMLYYAGKKLGILDNLVKYKLISKETLDYIDDEFIEDTLNVDDKEKIYLDMATQIISSIIYSSDLSGKTGNKRKTK